MDPIKLIPLHAGYTETWSNGAENLAVHLTCDLANAFSVWPDAVPSVAFERADGQKYAHSWALQGTVVHIPLVQADTCIPGPCKCMITLTNGEGAANTCVYCGQIVQGIDTLNEPPSAPAAGMIEQVNAAAVRAEAAAERAQGTGSTGGAGILFVRLSSADGENYIADKDFATVQAAIRGGAMAYAIIEGTYYVPLIGMDDSAVIFSIAAQVMDSLFICSAILAIDGSVTVSVQ